MSVQQAQNYIGISVFNGLAPTKGPRVLPLQLDFTSVTSIPINAAHAQENDRVEFIQGIYVDNSSNPSSLILTQTLTNQTIRFPAGSAGFVPFFTPNPPIFTASSTGGVIVNAVLTTFPVPAQLGQMSSFGSLGQDHSSAEPALAANLLGTIAVNGNRHSFGYQNQSANTHQLALDRGDGTQMTVLLIAPGFAANNQGGAYFDTTFKGRVRVFSASAGDQMALYER